MQTNKEAEQVTLSDLGICCGKMFQELSPAEHPKARTSVSSSKRSSELSAVPFMSLDLTPGHGNLLGESYWELISPWLGGAWMLNTGVSPNDARGSSLSQILQDAPPIKYYLSPKACLGILRRASERGKALPPKLERALKIQAGLIRPDGQPTDLNAFHINQRDEGIDLHGVSGALMATTNMQMQTFVTQPDDTVEGFDGYNGDLTGDVAATLGVNCGMSIGRNGVMAFAANQRDEVRDLHDVAGALNAQPGMKQQTFVAAAFSAGAGASAGSIGYGEELAPTLKGSASGNCMPSVLCLNDQGGSVMECSEDVSGTLRAQEHGHQPLVYENHGIDARYTGPHQVVPTMSARYGTGGNNVPLVEQEETFCITGNAIDRQPQNGGNGIGYQRDIAYTLTATDHHAVYSRQRVDDFRENGVVSTQSARQHKDATDLVCQKVEAYPCLKERPDVLEVLKKSDRKMKYMEVDLKSEQRRKNAENGAESYVPSKEDSLERLIYSAKCQFADDAEGVEDAVIRKDNLFRLRAALDQLSEEERALIHALFFDERSERELEEMMGVHRMTIHNRKIRILQKLKKMLR